jgi:hypothetical protein
MKVTRIEISLEWEESGEFEHEVYCDTIEDAIRYLKKLKKEQRKNEQEEEW